MSDELLRWAGGADRTDVPYLDGDLAGYAALSLWSVRAGDAFDVLLRRLSAVSGVEALPVASAALRRAFPDRPVTKGTPFDDLTEHHQLAPHEGAVVRTFVGSRVSGWRPRVAWSRRRKRPRRAGPRP